MHLLCSLVCACLRARMRVHVCVHACMRACVCVHVICAHAGMLVHKLVQDRFGMVQVLASAAFAAMLS